MNDKDHVRQLKAQLQDRPVPRCPHFQAARAERIYPVEGYCVLTTSPGLLMIPSIAEFNMYCTAVGFSVCPWFCGDKTRDHSGAEAGIGSIRSEWRPCRDSVRSWKGCVLP